MVVEKLVRTIQVCLNLDVVNIKKRNVILNHAKFHAFGLNGADGVVVLPTVGLVS